MGGHHQTRGASARPGTWEGYEALKQALSGLATAKGISQSRIGAVAKLAAQYAKFYKHVVHDIEMFIWKAEVEHRLAGLYAIDAILRQSQTKKDPKEQYIKRFRIRLDETFEAIKKVPESSKPKVQHVIEEWQNRGVYTAEDIEAAGGGEFLRAGTTGQASGNVTPRADPGKLASLLTILKQKKEQQGQASLASEQPQQQPFSAQEPARHKAPSYENGRPERDASRASYTPENRSYGGRALLEEPQGRREVGGIMGDAPGVPVGSGRVRRANDERVDELADSSRAPKKARGSRWGPKVPSNASGSVPGATSTSERPTPINTSLDTSSEYVPGSGRSAAPYASSATRAPALLPSPVGLPPRGADDWNRGPPRTSLQSESLSQGFPPPGRSDGNRYNEGGGAMQQRPPFPRHEGQRSPHPHGIPRDSHAQAPPGGELCRQFLHGHCNYGDRCRYVHDQQAPPQPRVDMNEPRRKTVLCKNFPLGQCRFGDNCSFAHGYDELGKPCLNARTPTHGGRWQESPHAGSGREDSSQQRGAPAAANEATAPSSQPPARTYDRAPQAVYNEPHAERGSSGGGASSMSYANAGASSPGGGRWTPTGQQPTSTAPPHTFAPPKYAASTAPYGSSNGSGFPRPGSSGGAQVPTPGTSGRVSPMQSSTVQTYQPTANGSVRPMNGAGAATTNAGPSKSLPDDDDGDTAEPEFTLQYDDED